MGKLGLQKDLLVQTVSKLFSQIARLPHNLFINQSDALRSANWESLGMRFLLGSQKKNEEATAALCNLKTF